MFPSVLNSTFKHRIKKYLKKPSLPFYRYPSGRKANMKQTTEDKPSNISATGHIDLLVYLPSGQATKMSVERRTPMLDVLIKICTRNNLQPSEYTLQPVDSKSPSSHLEKTFRCKPNTMVGMLGTHCVRVVPKVKSLPVTKTVPPPNSKPFENTFRLKVILPRNQLYVTRVSQNVYLYDIMKEVCDEKRLDESKYVFRHPAKSDEVLDLNLRIGDYQLTEIYLVNADQISRIDDNYNNNTNERTYSGVFNSMPRKARYSNGDSGSMLNHRFSASYTNLVNGIMDSKFALRKKRPAPTPPKKLDVMKETSAETVDYPEESHPRNENGFPSCHSRNSSDSSGYHEASLLSDHCITPPPHKPKSGDTRHNSENDDVCQNCDENYNTCNLNPLISKSVPNLAIRSRKKKAAPPPPILVKELATSNSTELSSPAVASQAS